MDCPMCEGHGELGCKQCLGSHQQHLAFEHKADEDCNECGGGGLIICPQCNGSGALEDIVEA